MMPRCAGRWLTVNGMSCAEGNGGVKGGRRGGKGGKGERREGDRSKTRVKGGEEGDGREERGREGGHVTVPGGAAHVLGKATVSGRPARCP